MSAASEAVGGQFDERSDVLGAGAIRLALAPVRIFHLLAAASVVTQHHDLCRQHQPLGNRRGQSIERQDEIRLDRRLQLSSTMRRQVEGMIIAQHVDGVLGCGMARERAHPHGADLNPS